MRALGERAGIDRGGEVVRAVVEGEVVVDELAGVGVAGVDVAVLLVVDLALGGDVGLLVGHDLVGQGVELGVRPVRGRQAREHPAERRGHLAGHVGSHLGPGARHLRAAAGQGTARGRRRGHVASRPPLTREARSPDTGEELGARRSDAAPGVVWLRTSHRPPDAVNRAIGAAAAPPGRSEDLLCDEKVSARPPAPRPRRPRPPRGRRTGKRPRRRDLRADRARGRRRRGAPTHRPAGDGLRAM